MGAMFLLIYLLIFGHVFPTVYCKKSFTIVLDTTNSMKEELEIIKTGIRVVMNDLVNRTDFEDYIIVPFNYPDVGTPSIAHSMKELVDDLNIIKAKDGVECPENSVAGIKKALEISEPGSSIYVFTDAYARDYGNISEITNLCINKFIQVQIFLSGVCLPAASNRTPIGNIDIYYDIVGTCSGAILRLDSAHNLRQVFPYITELNRIDWNDITTYDSFNERQELTFKIDTFTTNFMVVVSGDRPQVQILNHQGQAPRTMKIIDTKSTQVFYLLKPDVGDYTIYVSCQGTTSATLYRKHVLPYKYGFSTKEPRNLLETSCKPMPGKTNYILICSLDKSFRPGTIEFTDGKVKTELQLEKTGKPGTYITKALVESEKTYRISITGYNTKNNQQILATTKLLVPQKLESSAPWTQPSSKIIKEEIGVVEYGDNLTIVCKVHGYPKPKIQWIDERGNSLNAEEMLLEIPSIYLSYVTMNNVTVSSKIHCKCENSIGEASDSTEVVVKRTSFFEVNRKPENTTIKFGSDGSLYCAVNAYPEAVTKWLHNNTVLKNSDNILFRPEENSIVLKNMQLEDAGVYTCEIKNSDKTESYNAYVTITGLEMPKVEISEKEVIRKPGEDMELECSVKKGLPIPNVVWTYKSETDFYFGDLPDGTVVEGGKLKIASIETDHKGVYRCEAGNVMGQDFSEVNLKVQYSPVIEEDEVSILTVRDGENVVMTCRVRASPKATVRWEMSQDDVICNLDNRHRTDYLHTHSFTASWNDSGNYHCIAENSVGRAEKSITLNVLVAPYIEPPKSNTISVSVGGVVQLHCNVLFGNPAPSLKWKFIAPDTESSILKRDNSTNILSIKKVSESNEGWYICVVENEIGMDIIKYYVKVQ